MLSGSQSKYGVCGVRLEVVIFKVHMKCEGTGGVQETIGVKSGWR